MSAHFKKSDAMGVFFIYAGRQGSNLECALALHELARQSGFKSSLILSKDNSRADKIRKFYPDAEFFNFFSPNDIAKLRSLIGTGTAFFTMISPKIVPLILSLKSGKILYFHATYDLSLSQSALRDLYFDFLHRVAIFNSTITLATQHPLAWQIKARLGKEAGVLPHPPYSPIAKGFFGEEAKVPLPFRDYFLNFGGIDRISKGTQVLVRAVEGTNLDTVVAGKGSQIHGGKNLLHINRWLSDGELHFLIKHSKCVVLPYLTSSQFSGCLALAFHFKKPVLAPLSPTFEDWIVEGKTGWFFPQGDWAGLRDKMRRIAADGFPHSKPAIARLERQMAHRTKVRLAQALASLQHIHPPVIKQ
jgi:glycosyltransferase involved in cell wall biosynthesis